MVEFERRGTGADALEFVAAWCREQNRMVVCGAVMAILTFVESLFGGTGSLLRLGFWCWLVDSCLVKPAMMYCSMGFEDASVGGVLLFTGTIIIRPFLLLHVYPRIW